MNWSLCLPYLLAAIFSCGASRTKFVRHLASIPNIKQQILHCIEVIANDLVQCVMTHLPGKMWECRGANGGHLKNAISKCWWLQLIFNSVTIVCTYVLINYTFSKKPRCHFKNSRCKKDDKQVPYRGPTNLEWPMNLAVIWHFLVNACELIWFFTSFIILYYIKDQ